MYTLQTSAAVMAEEQIPFNSLRFINNKTLQNMFIYFTFAGNHIFKHTIFQFQPK